MCVEKIQGKKFVGQSDDMIIMIMMTVISLYVDTFSPIHNDCHDMMPTSACSRLISKRRAIIMKLKTTARELLFYKADYSWRFLVVRFNHDIKTLTLILNE